jgi:hypothetical protein
MRDIMTEENAWRLIKEEFDQELEEYLIENSTRKQREILSEEDYQHIAHCLKDLVADLFKLYPAGDLAPILENDFSRAVGACDDINILALNLFNYFLVNKIPATLLWERRHND